MTEIGRLKGLAKYGVQPGMKKHVKRLTNRRSSLFSSGHVRFLAGARAQVLLLSAVSGTVVERYV